MFCLDFFFKFSDLQSTLLGIRAYSSITGEINFNELLFQFSFLFFQRFTCLSNLGSDTILLGVEFIR